MLRRRSRYFEAMLNSQFLEASQEIVTINVATGSTVCATVLVMRYLYTGNIRIMPGNVFELLAAADMLMLDKLRRDCAGFLEGRITTVRGSGHVTESRCNGACSILNSSTQLLQLNLGYLLEACVRFILKTGTRFLSCDGFLGLSKAHVIAIISNADLEAAEEDVLKAAKLWAMAEVGRRTNGNCRTETRRSVARAQEIVRSELLPFMDRWALQDADVIDDLVIGRVVDPTTKRPRDDDVAYSQEPPTHANKRMRIG
jgi:hypothetical protein